MVGVLDFLKKISVHIGYNKVDHKFDSSRLPNGDAKLFNDNTEAISNKDGLLNHCKKDARGNWRCEPMPIKKRY